MNNKNINQRIGEFIDQAPTAHGKMNLEEALTAPPYPNYCSDLNAMHEAEKHLSIDQEYNYGEELRKISENIGPKGGHFTPNGWGCFAMAHLDARQKAEAFIKVIQT
jgi:hypothetical protein